MNKLHSYSLADLKYNIKRSKSKQYSRFLKKNIKTQKGSGEHVGNNNKHMFDIEDVYDEDEEIRKIFIGKSDANMCMVGMIFDSTPEEIVILSDEASFNCIDALSKRLEKIPLYKLYLIKYKSSYYTHNHDFIIEKERNSIVHHNNVSKLDTLTFDYNMCIIELKTQKITLPDNISDIIHKQSEYSYEDIKKIITELAEHKYCEILDIVLEYIFKTNKLTNLSGVLYYKDL